MRVLEVPGAGDQGPVAGEVERARARAALLGAGTNGVPFLLACVLAEPGSSEGKLGRGLEGSWLGERFRAHAAAEEVRREEAMALLVELGPPWELLRAAMGDRLSADGAWGSDLARVRALRCLGAVGANGRDGAVRELGGWLQRGTASEVDAAARALSRLGPDSIRGLGVAWVPRVCREAGLTPGVVGLLGHLGPAAHEAVPALRRAWDRESDRRHRIRLSVALCRVAPGEDGFWQFLESVAADGSGAGAGMRDLAGAFAEDGVEDVRFAPLLVRALAVTGQRWPLGGGQALAVLQRMDPEAVADFFRARLAESTAPDESVRAAACWLRLQASNEEPRARLRALALGGGAEAVEASWHLARQSGLPATDWDLVSEVAGARTSQDPSAEARRELQQWLAWRWKAASAPPASGSGH